MPSPPPDAIEYVVATADEVAADADFAALYDASFPANEREPLAVIGHSVRTGPGLVLRARAGGRTIGLASLHLTREPRLAFLVYLAVSSARRRQGIGVALFEAAWREAARRTDPIACVWEIDGPTDVAEPTERAQRDARLAFFRKLGGEVLCETYRQPPVNGPTPVPMWLMGRRATGKNFPPTRDIVSGIYFEKYGAMNGIDRKLLARMLEGK